MRPARAADRRQSTLSVCAIARELLQGRSLRCHRSEDVLAAPYICCMAECLPRRPLMEYGQAYTPGIDAEGNIDAMSLWAGQSVGIVSKVQSAADIVREISDQARLILRQLAQ